MKSPAKIAMGIVSVVILIAIAYMVIPSRVLPESLVPVRSSLWNPTGEWLVVTCPSGAWEWDADMYLVRPDGTDLHRLTKDRAYNGSVDWSPNGDWIVLESGTSGYRPTDIYLIRPDGSEFRQLTNTEHVAEISPRYSPDGTHIAYLSWERHSVLIGDTETMLQIMSFETDVVQQIPLNPNANTLSWSPDGRSIMFGVYAIGTPTDFYEISLEDKQEVFVTSVEGLADSDWSPQNAPIISTHHGIYRLNRDGDLTSLITFPPGSVIKDAVLSPSGEQIAYVSGAIYVIDVKTLASQRVIDISDCMPGGSIDWFAFPSP